MPRMGREEDRGEEEGRENIQIQWRDIVCRSVIT
jgi:hypothetical protein